LGTAHQSRRIAEWGKFFDVRITGLSLPYEEDLSFRRIHQIDDYGDGLRKSASSCAILRGKRARRGVVRDVTGALFYCGG
jgi:hypothetical protein